MYMMSGLLSLMRLRGRLSLIGMLRHLALLLMKIPELLRILRGSRNLLLLRNPSFFLFRLLRPMVLHRANERDRSSKGEERKTRIEEYLELRAYPQGDDSDKRSHRNVDDTWN